MSFELRDEVVKAVVARLVGHLRNRHVRIGQQLAGMLNPNLGQALEDAFTRPLLEVAAQRRGVLLDMVGHVAERDVFLEVIVQVGIDPVDGFFDVGQQVRSVVGCVRQQFDVPAVAQPFEYVEQGDDALGVFGVFKVAHPAQQVVIESFVVEPHAILALLQQGVDVTIVGDVLHVDGKQLGAELQGLAGAGFADVPALGVRRCKFRVTQVQMGYVAPDECHVARPEVRHAFADELFPASLGEKHDFVFRVLVQRKYKARVRHEAAPGVQAVRYFTFEYCHDDCFCSDCKYR